MYLRRSRRTRAVRKKKKERRMKRREGEIEEIEVETGRVRWKSSKRRRREGTNKIKAHTRN